MKGAEKSVEKLHAQGKMTARERIEYLLDEGKPQLEVGAFAGYEMYAEHGGCPAGGVVVMIGYVRGRQCIVVANDATVKAGAWFPITGKKTCERRKLPWKTACRSFIWSTVPGSICPCRTKFSQTRNTLAASFATTPACPQQVFLKSRPLWEVALPGAYLPIMSDEALIVEGTGSVFLAGPYLVKAAIGEDVDQETLGGAATHSEISGVTDYKMPDDKTCLDTIKDLVDKMGRFETAGFDRQESRPAAGAPEDMFSIFPDSSGKPYDSLELLRRIVDGGELTQYKEHYGKTIICAYARIDGWAVGIVANNRQVVKNAKGEIQFGGVIYSDSADKATRFILNCNQKKIPLVFLHDVTGFMVGTRSEHGGIIKDGAKMVNAVANSTVPKFSVVLGNSYGAGNYAMCGKAYDPRLIVAWPTAKIAVMGGEQSAKVLTQIQVASLKKQGEAPDPKAEKELFEKIKNRYDAQTTPYYAAARLWVDAIIDPRDTRQWISMGIEAANNAVVGEV